MNKTLSCFLCFLPLVLYVIVCVPLFIASVMVELGYDLSGVLAILLFVGALILVVATYGVMIWLIVKTVKNQNMDTNTKVIWSVLLYMINVVTFPIYWFVVIRKEP